MEIQNSEERQTFSRTQTFRQTFFRSYTLDPTQQFRPTEVGEGLGFTPKTEDEWKEGIAAIMLNVEQHQGTKEGDIPIPAAFATDPEFWKCVVLLCFVGGIIGIISSIFMNIVKKVPEMWTSNHWDPSVDDDFFHCDCVPSLQDPNCGCTKYTNFDYYRGPPYWIGVPPIAGLAVGLIRYFTSYPETRPGLFKEILDFYVDPGWSPVALLISAISLAGGACLGPEQALSNIGGGTTVFLINKFNALYGLPPASPNSPSIPLPSKKPATPTIPVSTPLLTPDPTSSPPSPASRLNNALNTLKTRLQQFRSFHFSPPYQKVMVLGGIAAALGSLFPTPVLAVMMMHELGNPPKSYMESTLIMAVPACSAFLCFTALLDRTYIQSISSESEVLAFQWQYSEINCLVGVAVGVVSAALGLTMMIFLGMCKQILNRIRFRLSFSPFLRTVLPSVLAGTAIGAVNWALPITVGNGEMILPSLISYGAKGLFSARLLICSGFAKMFLLGVSMNGGFIGGFVFPIITISVISALVANTYYPSTPLALFLGCFMASLPTAICPMPLTFVCLACFVFYLGLYDSAPLFLASITSYSLVCGSGLLGRMMKQGRKVDAQAREADEEYKRKHERRQQSDSEDKPTTTTSPLSSSQPLTV